MKNKQPSVVGIGVKPSDRERLRTISATTGKKIYAIIRELLDAYEVRNAAAPDVVK